MATPNEGHPNPQSNEIDHNEGNPEQVIESGDESNRDIPALFVPDLRNSILSDAIRDGMRVGTPIMNT